MAWKLRRGVGQRSSSCDHWQLTLYGLCQSLTKPTYIDIVLYIWLEAFLKRYPPDIAGCSPKLVKCRRLPLRKHTQEMTIHFGEVNLLKIGKAPPRLISICLHVI